MIRPIAETVRQLAAPNPYPRFTVRVAAVDIVGRTVSVMGRGYSGPSRVRVPYSLDMGTVGAPKIFLHNLAVVEKQPDNQWIVTEFDGVNNCSPETTAVAPNVPLPHYTPPVSTSGWNPPVGLPLPDFPISNILPTLYPHAGDWRPEVYLCTTLGVYYTSNFTGPGGTMPTWTKIDGGLPGGCSYTAFEPDPWRPSKRQYVIVTDGTYKLYRRTTGDWSLMATAANGGNLFTAVQAVQANLQALSKIAAIQCDINQDGYIGLWVDGYYPIAYYASWYLWSTDYGATWQSGPTISGGVNSTLRFGEIGDLKGNSAQAAGQLVYSPLYSDGSYATNGFFRSRNKGVSASWVTVTDLDGEVCGFSTDVYQDILYWWKDTFLRRSLDQGDNWSDIYDAATYGNILSSWENNGAYRYKVHALLGTATGATTIRVANLNNRIVKTTDAGLNWTLQAAPSGFGTDMRLGLSLVHDADGKLYGLNHHSNITHTDSCAIYASDDEGANWDPKAGANSGTAPYTDSIPYNAGVLAILQCWET